MFYSHRRVGQPGPMTRILCCTKEEYSKLSEVEKTLVPTHWAPSYTVHPRTGDVYHAYNKPLAVLDWMSKVEVKEDFVLVIDADMIMREPFIPEELGAKPGWAVAAYFGYMKGTDNQLALTHVPEVIPRNDTLAGRKGRRGDMAGGFTLMAREDMRRVAPLWLKYTERVREDPGAWNLTGDEWTKKPGDKPWISEMYGYSFGCAKADVWHITHSEHMLYPGYDTVDPPKVLHYGLHWSVKGYNYEFDKHWHFDFDPLVCPPWELSDDPKKTKKGLFAHPPSPKQFTTTGFDLLRDLLSVEPIILLNAAFCERHLKNCPPTEELTRECNRAHQLEMDLDEVSKSMQLPDPCVNRAKECEWWASVGECEKTAGWMYSHCRPACKWCTPRDKGQETKAIADKSADGGAATATDAQQQQQDAAAAADKGAAQGEGAQGAAQEATATQGEGSTAKQGEAATQQQAASNTAAQEGTVAATAQQDGAADPAATKRELIGQLPTDQQQQAGGSDEQGQKDAAAGKGAGTLSGAQQRQQEAAAAQDAAKAETEAGESKDGAAGAASKGKGDADAVIKEHAKTLAQPKGHKSRVDQDLSDTRGEDANKHMPLLASEMFGLQAVVSHHIQMLAVFWGAILVAVLFKMRRRLFKPRHHHLRPRLLNH
ncbi:hypothetical protein N2152v2_002701 [Parachlorella kessleri]